MLEQVLGPRWSLKELRTFYILLKAHGQQWEKLEERLPHRSSAMMRALFAMHRGYLALPEASVEGFCTIMMDYYEMQKKRKGTRRIDENQVYGNRDIGNQEVAVSRSRKKRRLDKFQTVDQVTTLQIQTKSHEKPLKRALKREKQRKSLRPMKARAWLFDDNTGLDKVYGIRFELPWSHWFYSYVDVDFFAHNEFMECLSRMGLEKIETAARPIWSSVRTSMGRPRRLSRLFFTQEKEKLETFRVVKRRADHMQLSTDTYRCSPQLQPGMPVIVWVKAKRRFRFATVAAFRATENTCRVFFSENGSPPVATECSLDNVMVLTIPPCSGKSEATSAKPKLSATMLRRESEIRGGAPILSTPKATDSIGNWHHSGKIQAILAVKSLLHRKERIVSSMANLNECVADRQIRLHEKDAMKSSLRRTPTTISSAAVEDLTWTDSHERCQFQKQHSWLAANLDATNEHLKTALLTLQSFSTINPSATENYDTKVANPSDSLKCGNMMPTETLTEGQIRWAMDFLAASQRKAAIVVAEVAKDDKELSSVNSLANETRPGNVLPETMQLVVNCITLMSVLHRHVAASPDVSPVVTQKLVERVLELLKPSHEANMDLYAELHAAANAAQAQMVLQASTRNAD